MKNLGVLPVLLFLSFSCSSRPAVDKVIRPLKTTSEKFSAKVIRSIPLAPGNEVLIDQIDGLEYFKRRFYIQDYSARNVSIFSDDGALIRRIGKGKGPGELSISSGMGFGPESLIIADGPQIRKYSLDGIYQETKPLPPRLFAHEINQLPNGNYLTYGMALDIGKEIKEDFFSNQFYYFLVLDTSLTRVVLSMVPFTNDYGGMERDKAYCFYKDHYLFSEGLGNHLVQFDGQRITELYTIDFEKFTFSEEELREDKFKYLQKIADGSRYGLIEEINETQDHISFRFHLAENPDKGATRSVIYSKRTGQTGILSDILRASGIPEMELVNTCEEEFLFLLQPSDFTGAQLRQFYEQGIIGPGITPESNPVLVMVRMQGG